MTAIVAVLLVLSAAGATYSLLCSAWAGAFTLTLAALWFALELGAHVGVLA